MTRLDDLRCQYLESLIALIAPATDPALFDRIERLLWATDEPVAPPIAVEVEQPVALPEPEPANDPRPPGWASPVDKLLQDEPEPPPKPSGRNLGGGYTRKPIPCDVCAEPYGRGAGMVAHVKAKHPGATQDWRGKWVLPDVHVHRWVLSTPNGDGVRGACECGARRIDPAVIGGDQAVSFKRIKTVCPDCGGVVYADRHGRWCNSCNKAVAVVS